MYVLLSFSLKIKKLICWLDNLLSSEVSRSRSEPV